MTTTDETRGYAPPAPEPTGAPRSNGTPAAEGAPTRRPPSRPRRPRRPRELTATDLATTAGSLFSAVCACWLVYGVLTQGIGWFGFLLSVFVVFLVLLYVVTADRLGSIVAKDRVVTAVVYTGAVVLLIPLAWILIYVVVRGLPAFRPWSFLTEDQRGITPLLPSTAGGGSHAVVGTIQQVGLALVWSLPLALLAAVFLNESRSRWRRPVRIFVDAMSGLPSILAGLFIYAVLILPYAKRITLFSFNGFMASLALALIMVPTITRTVEVVLRLVPDGLREASLALGSSKARTTWSVVLPTARTGITTAVILGIARAVGETAPLILTSFGYDLMNPNPFSGPQASLPLFVYQNVKKPAQTAIDRGFAGALVLMLLVLGLFGIARFIGRDRTRGTARRAARRTAGGSTDPGVRGRSA